MKLHIFILCYNEEVLLPHTIAHYRKNIPECIITIYDNYSTDRSVEIAKSLNCNVILWKSDNPKYEKCIDDHKYLDIKNNCWKDVSDGWIIMCDMDEWLCVTQEELKKEKEENVSILRVKGYNIVCESKTLDLSDLDIHSENKGVYHIQENKKLCFLREKIVEINYRMGAHNCNPVGVNKQLKHSSKTYINKHMNWLGLEYVTEKYKNRYERIKNVHFFPQIGKHYTDDKLKVKEEFNNFLNERKVIEELE